MEDRKTACGNPLFQPDPGRGNDPAGGLGGVLTRQVRPLSPLSHKQSVSHSELFNAPAAAVWELLIDWSGIVNWMPDGYIRELQMEGQGLGAIRHLVTGQGVKISERLDEIDAPGGRLNLSIIEPLPWGMLSYTARAQLDSSGNDQCRLGWRGTFELPAGGAAAAELAKLLKKSYIKMFEGIRSQLPQAG